MKTGDDILWGGKEFTILVEYDESFVYLAVCDDGAQLVHKSDLALIRTFHSYG